MRHAVSVLVLLGVLGGTAAPVVADEVKTPISASLLLSITAPRTPDRDLAYQQSLRDSGPTPAPPAFPAGEVQEDGSVKYGSVTVTVRNPCPPNSGHYDAALPGRRAK